MDNGYNKSFLNQNFILCYLCLFLFLMTGLASIFTMNTLKQSDNLKLIIIGLLTFFILFQRFIFGLEKRRISITLAIWSPVIALSFFVFMGCYKLMKIKY